MDIATKTFYLNLSTNFHGVFMKSILAIAVLLASTFSLAAESMNIQPSVLDLTESGNLLIVLQRVQPQYQEFLKHGNVIRKIESTTLMDSAKYTLVIENCNYGPKGPVCEVGATLKIDVLMGGQFVGATVSVNP
jgi:hypothetical protein